MPTSWRARFAGCAVAVLLHGACKSKPADPAPVRDKNTSEVRVDAAVALPLRGTSPHALAPEPALGVDGEVPAFKPCLADDVTHAGVLLDRANRRYRAGDFAEAYSCAEMAGELVPQGVEAHHLRAAALTGLARFGEAQVAFALALALDPDDPETLADVADFYINILPPKRRQTVRVGLEYARLGSERALARRRFDENLVGRLLLLEAEAHNDLGDSELALDRLEEARSLAPSLDGLDHERAISLFNLLRFEESEKVFLRVLEKRPDDPYAHHHLALILERRGSYREADAHFARAAELAPSEFFAPVLLTPDEFQAELDRAVAELSPELRKLLQAATLEVEDLPATDDLSASSPPFSPTILGLFRGLPAGIEAQAGDEEPRSIVLYRRNLGRAVRSRDELNRQIRNTLRHELGHLEGYDEGELRRRGME